MLFNLVNDFQLASLTQSGEYSYSSDSNNLLFTRKGMEDILTKIHSVGEDILLETTDFDGCDIGKDYYYTFYGILESHYDDSQPFITYYSIDEIKAISSPDELGLDKMDYLLQ